jgi:hypothetical protein
MLMVLQFMLPVLSQVGLTKVEALVLEVLVFPLLGITSVQAQLRFKSLHKCSLLLGLSLDRQLYVLRRSLVQHLRLFKM